MPDFIEQLSWRLAELGCPRAQVVRLVREVADHREDLKQAAWSNGLSEAGAEIHANAQLGDPVELAEDLMAALRRSTWWGRHYVVTFVLLPLLAYPVLWALLLCLQMALEFALGYGWDSNKLRAAADDPVTFQHLLMKCHCMDYLAMVLATLLFCWLARRAVVSPRWMTISCAICSLAAVITYARIEPHSFFLGFSLNSHLQMPWFRGAIPLLMAGAAYFLRRRTIRRFQERVAG